MINISEIKIGDSLMRLRQLDNQDAKSRNIIGEPLPSCCDSVYKMTYNLDNRKCKRYMIVDDTGIITDITEDDSKAINWESTRKNIDFILSNR